MFARIEGTGKTIECTEYEDSIALGTYIDSRMVRSSM